jgi:two-component system response regulator PilR (NtrC family)
VIAATNRNLEEAVAKGTFREDLYYRLNVILIRTPALRERKSDIQMLAETFLKRASDKQKKALTGFSPEAMAALEAHQWPGNIRELENVVERAVTLEPGNIVTFASLPSAVRAGAAAPAGRPEAQAAPGAEIRLPAPDFSKGPINLDEILGHVEKTYLTAALDSAGGKKKKAAELLGITFRSIRYRLSKAGVDSADDSGEEA